MDFSKWNWGVYVLFRHFGKKHRAEYFLKEYVWWGIVIQLCIIFRLNGSSYSHNSYEDSYQTTCTRSFQFNMHSPLKFSILRYNKFYKKVFSIIPSLKSDLFWHFNHFNKAWLTVVVWQTLFMKSLYRDFFGLIFF